MSATSYALRQSSRGTLYVDPVVVALVAALLLVGLVMVTSASVTLAAHDGDPFFFLERQLAFAGLGAVLAAVALRIPTETWERLHFVLLAVSMLLLVCVLVPMLGHRVNGSRRWLSLLGLNFQASEAARVLLLLYLCSYVVRREEEVRTTLIGFLKPLGMLGIAALLLLAEPDMGAGVVLLATSMLVLLLAGVKVRHFVAVSLVCVAIFGVLAKLSPYRWVRITAFLNPWEDPYKTGFQLTQSLMAIGHGHWFGVGLGASVQKLFYLPEAHTDFVFSVLAEELGFVGVVGVLLLVIALSYRALAIARNAAEAGLKFQSYLAASFGIWFGLQALINIAVTMGALPTKGLTLPLLSYGRSSLVVTIAWIGILLRVHHETQSSRSVAIRGVSP